MTFHFRYLCPQTVLLISSTSLFGQLVKQDADTDLSANASGLTFTVAPRSLVGGHRKVRAGVNFQRPRWNYLLYL